MSHPPGRLWPRFMAITRPFVRSELRWHALGMLSLILFFILCLGGLNVLGSYMNRNFMTAAADHEGGRLLHWAILWASVFAALTVVAVFKAFTEERLRLAWRGWLTRHLLSRYLAGRAYLTMKGRADIDNPDQRLTEDVRTFTEHALALFLIFTNSTIALISFSGVLWSITPWLFLAAVGYAAFGSGMTVLLGRRLVKLDVQQYRKEADLRYDVIQVRNQAETIARNGAEQDERNGLMARLAAVIANMKGIIGLSRNISFFTTGYDYLILLLPLLIVAPLFIRGEVEFGAITQAQMAFGHVMGAFSIIVKEFQRISAFGAAVERLGTFCEALDEATGDNVQPRKEKKREPRAIPSYTRLG